MKFISKKVHQKVVGGSLAGKVTENSVEKVLGHLQNDLRLLVVNAGEGRDGESVESIRVFLFGMVKVKF